MSVLPALAETCPELCQRNRTTTFVRAWPERTPRNDDGQRVQSTLGATTTGFIGTWFEWMGSTSTMVKYYVVYPESMRRAGSQRLAMRTGGSANANLTWLFGDHPSTALRTSLGSTSVTADLDGDVISRTLYKPLPCTQGRLWGEVRYQSGTLPTKYTYTGQYSHTTDFGLMYYVARWYDPVLSRFAQADSIVPGAGNPLAWDRFAYAYNSPLNYTDPSGHFAEKDIPLLCKGCKTWEDVANFYHDDLILSLLQNPLITFGSVALAGNAQGVTAEYGFFLQGDEEDNFSFLVVNLTTGDEATLSEILAHAYVTVWSTNTEVGEGGYFYTNWNKGHTDEVSAKQWATPSFNGVDDFIAAGSKYSETHARTGPRKYYDINGWFFYDVVTFWNNPATAIDLATMGIDAAKLTVDLTDDQFYDGVYPMMYTGPNWLAPSQYLSSGYLALSHPGAK